MRRIVLMFLAFCLGAISLAGPFSEFPVLSGPLAQQNPDVDGTIVVWQEDFDSEITYEWNIIATDIDDVSGDYVVFGYTGYADLNPAVSGNKVVWQNEYDPGDHDIFLGNIDSQVQYAVSETTYNETHPDIHGNRVVWQERYEDEIEPGDWNIYSADMLNPADPNVWPVCIFTEDQIHPAVFRSNVVFADYFTPEAQVGRWDITLTDTWLRDQSTHSFLTYDELNPMESIAPAIDADFIVYQQDSSGDGTDYDIYLVDRSDSRVDVVTTVSALGSSAVNPAISGHIVVWQDDRNDNWDIYGYNRVTGQEFQITDDPADQMVPSISGELVVWQDQRGSESQIYGAYLTAEVTANCDGPVAGDVDGNCRVDLADFAQMAQNWMICDLIPASACNN